MRIDIVTIFPDYLAPLELSLIGRARRDHLIDVRVHDLRDVTHDRHRTVDDTPFGGGAGMVMMPQPWKEALDALVAGSFGSRPRLVVPGPSGRRFDQRLAVVVVVGTALQQPAVLACQNGSDAAQRDRRQADRRSLRAGPAQPRPRPGTAGQTGWKAH